MKYANTPKGGAQVPNATWDGAQGPHCSVRCETVGDPRETERGAHTRSTRVGMHLGGGCSHAIAPQKAAGNPGLQLKERQQEPSVRYKDQIGAT